MNPVISSDSYPWLAFLLGYDEKKSGKLEMPFICTGCIIGKRYTSTLLHYPHYINFYKILFFLLVYEILVVTQVGILLYLRTILTAAHCICSHVIESADPKDPGHLCIPAPNNESPKNQINQDRSIYYVIGQKTIDLRLYYANNNEIKKIKLKNREIKTAERAYILQTRVNAIGQVTMNPSKDIGLLIVGNIITTSTAAIIKTLTISSRLV